MNERFWIIASIAGIIGGLAAIGYMLLRDATPAPEPFVEQREAFSEVVETPTVAGGITVRYYGGPSDIRTLLERGTEYALIKNPAATGDLTLAATEGSNQYYFATNLAGERVAYTQGDSRGMHGYDEVGLVSGKLVRDRIPAAEYFIAYPDSTSARIANFPEIADTGIANRYLASQVVRITNKNTGRSVVAEIDHRSTDDELLISEAVGRELELTSGATGNLQLELLPFGSIPIGPVR
ncbi:MAG: hypothetical protein RL150_585 [Candidatus Parcubacteria bacterium]|jgi:hypothetical protein